VPEQKFSFTMEAANATYRFLRMVASALGEPHPGFSVKPHPDARDNNGAHWRGLRATITAEGSARLYIHTGLVYHPDTRRGIYLEIDRKNNLGVYRSVWDNLGESALYDLCKDEPDYLKCFYPDAKLDLMMSEPDAGAQKRLWNEYFEACVTAMLAALKGGAF
jgi:hypothetical protein